MGNNGLRPTNNPAILRVVADLIDHLTQPPGRPVDLTLPPKILENGNPEDLIKRAKEELHLDANDDYNIAVVGAIGVGKSSFINGIRLVHDTDEDAAPIGEVETIATVMKPYRHRYLPHAVLWDLPPGGTPKHPAATYFINQKLCAFDVIFIVSADRFQRMDFEVVKGAVEFNMKRLAFVRTKADEAVKRIAEREKVSLVEASKKLREAVEASWLEGLRRAGIKLEKLKGQQVKLFFVSSHAFLNAYAYHGEPQATNAAPGEEEDENYHKMDEDLVYAFVNDSIKQRRQKNMRRMQTSRAPRLPPPEIQPPLPQSAPPPVSPAETQPPPSTSATR